MKSLYTDNTNEETAKEAKGKISITCASSGKINIVKMLLLLKVMYKVDVIPIKTGISLDPEEPKESKEKRTMLE